MFSVTWSGVTSTVMLPSPARRGTSRRPAGYVRGSDFRHGAIVPRSTQRPGESGACGADMSLSANCTTRPSALPDATVARNPVTAGETDASSSHLSPSPDSTTNW
ncbi:hypothetical protein [Kutzneria kofuensis]|uniref:hypothetical protein n=1 Tax=Kutzneria kofuensis TaxID=103725 RepID=UPI0031E87278